MTEYFIFRNNIIKSGLILSTIFITLFFVTGENRLAYGFIFGAIVSIINFYIMSLSNMKVLNLSNNKKNILNFVSKNLVLRYLLYFLTLLIALKHSLLSFSGTIFGIFIIPLTVLLKNFI